MDTQKDLQQQEPVLNTKEEIKKDISATPVWKYDASPQRQSNAGRERGRKILLVEEKENFFERMIRNSMDENLKLKYVQSKGSKAMRDQGFDIIEPVQKKDMVENVLPVAKKDGKWTSSEEKEVKEYKKTFKNADLCTVRELNDMQNYIEDGGHKSFDTLKEDGMDIKDYVESIMRVDITMSVFNDDYLSTHMVELYDYCQKLKEVPKLRQEFPAYFDSLPTEKVMVLEAKASIAGDIENVLFSHMHLHGIHCAMGKNGLTVELRNEIDSKSFRELSHREDENVYQDSLNDLRRRMNTEGAVRTAEIVAKNESYNYANAIQSVEESISVNQDMYRVFRNEYKAAYGEIKRALFMRDEIIEEQKQLLKEFNNLPEGKERNNFNVAIRHNNRKIFMLSRHTEYYREYIDFLNGNVPTISHTTEEFLKLEEQEGINETIRLLRIAERVRDKDEEGNLRDWIKDAILEKRQVNGEVPEQNVEEAGRLDQEQKKEENQNQEQEKKEENQNREQEQKEENQNREQEQKEENQNQNQEKKEELNQDNTENKENLEQDLENNEEKQDDNQNRNQEKNDENLIQDNNENKENQNQEQEKKEEDQNQENLEENKDLIQDQEQKEENQNQDNKDNEENLEREQEKKEEDHNQNPDSNEENQNLEQQNREKQQNNEEQQVENAEEEEVFDTIKNKIDGTYREPEEVFDTIKNRIDGTYREPEKVDLVKKAMDETNEYFRKNGTNVMQKRNTQVVEPKNRITVADNIFEEKMKQPVTERKQNRIMLFGRQDRIEIKDIKQNTNRFDCYLISTLAGIAKRNPAYIRYLVRDNANEPNDYADVRLFDKDGNLRVITVEKTICDNDSARPLWIQLIEKAAAVLLESKMDYGIEANVAATNKGANYRNAPHTNGDKISVRDTDKGSEELASKLLFGRKGIYLSTRDDDENFYDETFRAKEVKHKAGDEAVGKILAYLKKGKIIVSSTCTNKKDGDGHYNKWEDSVKFPVELEESHAFLIMGEGAEKNGQKTLKVRDPFTGGLIDLTYDEFQTCFTDVYVSDIEDEEWKKNLPDEVVEENDDEAEEEIDETENVLDEEEINKADETDEKQKEEEERLRRENEEKEKARREEEEERLRQEEIERQIKEENERRKREKEARENSRFAKIGKKHNSKNKAAHDKLLMQLLTEEFGKKGANGNGEKVECVPGNLENMQILQGRYRKLVYFGDNQQDYSYVYEEGTDQELIDTIEWLMAYYVREKEIKDRKETEELRTMKMPSYKKSVDVKGGYEKQAQGSNNCWACAGTAIFRHFVMKRDGIRNLNDLKETVNQYNMREYKPKAIKDLKKIQAQGLSVDNKLYRDYANNALSYMGKGKNTVGNIYEDADFFMEKDSNFMLNRMLIQIPASYKTIEGIKVAKTEAEKKRDQILIHNQKVAFVKQIKEVLDSGNLVAVLNQKPYAHYRTITGIFGEKVTYLDSSSGTAKFGNIDDIFIKQRTDADPVELTWFSEVPEPEELQTEFSNLTYDEEKEEYGVENLEMESALNVFQTKGVSVGKTEEELEEKFGKGVQQISYSSYIPKKVTRTNFKKQKSKK